MKNLIKISMVASMILSLFPTTTYALAINADSVEANAQACMNSVVSQNTLKPENVKSYHEKRGETLNNYQVGSIKEEASACLNDDSATCKEIRAHAFIADSCAAIAHDDIDPALPDADCLHPVKQESIQTKDETSRKKYAAQYFCLNKAAFDMNIKNHYTVGQTEIDKSDESNQITSTGDMTEETYQNVSGDIYEKLQQNSEKFYEALQASSSKIGASGATYCRNQFGGPSGDDIRAYEGADQNANFKSFAQVMISGSGLVELHEDLQVKTPQHCVGTPNRLAEMPAPFSDGKKGDIYRSPFFIRTTDSNAAGEIARSGAIDDRFCFDRARQYCAPALEFYSQCENIQDANIKKACQTISYKTFVDCAGSYNNETLFAIKLPNIFDEGSSQSLQTYFEQSNPDPASDGEAQSDISQIYSSFNSNPSLITLEQASVKLFRNDNDLVTKIKSRTLAQNFHDFYGMCVVYREASKKNDNDAGIVPVGDVTASVNGTHKCKLASPWSSDFKYCNMSILWVDGFSDILSVATNTTMGVVGAVKSQNAMNESTQQAMEGDPTGAMTIQKQELKNKSSLHYANAAVDTTTAVGSFIAWSKYPSPKGLESACLGKRKPIYRSREIDCGMFHAYSENWVEYGDRAATYASIFPNSKTKEVLMMKMIQKFGSGLLNGMMGKEYARQAGMLDKLQEGYQDFYQDPSIGLGSGEDPSLSYCRQNPTVPSCRGGGRRDNGVQGGMGFNGGVQQGQGGSNFGFGDSNVGEFTVDEEIDPSKRKAIDDLKGVIGSTKRNKFGDDFNAPGAAKGSMGGGGGAGSISGSAGGGGGGGGGAPGGGAAGAKSQSGPSVSKNKYTAGTGDSFKYKAGGSDSRSSKSKNPFASMIGKKNRKVASQVTDDIGEKSSKLFEKISKAYSKAKKDNRLINIQSE